MSSARRFSVVVGGLGLVLAAVLLVVPTSVHGEDCGSFLMPQHPEITVDELHDRAAAAGVVLGADQLLVRDQLQAEIRSRCDAERQDAAWPTAALIAVTSAGGLGFGLAGPRVATAGTARCPCGCGRSFGPHQVGKRGAAASVAGLDEVLVELDQFRAHPDVPETARATADAYADRVRQVRTDLLAHCHGTAAAGTSPNLLELNRRGAMLTDGTAALMDLYPHR